MSRGNLNMSVSDIQGRLLADNGITAEDWFFQQVARGAVRPFAELVTITPPIATVILSRNPANRPLKKTVNQIADDIISGRWRINGETIIISKEGLLNDGQNRLAAVIVANRPIQCLIYFGADRDSRLTVDMGLARTAGDFLGMQGAINGNICAAVAKLLSLYRRGLITDPSPAGMSKQAILAYYNENRTQIDNAVKYLINKKFVLRVGATPIVCAYIILTDVNRSAAEHFFEALLTGEGLQKGDAILHAREHLYDSGHQRLRAWEKLELILRYWNSWRQGKAVNRDHSVKRVYPKVER